MKKILFYFMTLISILWLCSRCAVQLNTLNQKTTKKCSACKKFLTVNQIFDVHLKEYNKSTRRGYTEYIIPPDSSLLERRKAMFMDSEMNTDLYNHKFCFIGMKKEDVEARFSSQLNKFSSPDSGVNNIDWVTVYTYNVGTLDKDSAVVVDFASSIYLYYQIIEEDTLYSAFPNDIHLLKNCLDAEGVKYEE